MKALGIILAGGGSRRMKELSNLRAPSAMPIAGSFRAIDFTLSNMSNSNVKRVGVITQFNSVSLNEHLNSSKWWDFGRKQGGLFVFAPTITNSHSDWYRGTADSIYQNLNFLYRSHEPYVIIASGDCVYKMDYNALLDYHIKKGADITVLTKDMGEDIDTTRYGVVTTDEDGRILEIEEKPLDSPVRKVSCGIYVIRRRLLIELVEQGNSEDRFDIVRDILIKYRRSKKIYAYNLETYWSNISSVDDYFRTNMDFLKPEVRRFFFDTAPEIYSKIEDLPPVKYNPGSDVKNSLIASGSIVNGYVEDSVVFKNVYIGNGSRIKNCILLNDVYIGDNVVLENCIVESRSSLNAGSSYIGEPGNPQVVAAISGRHII